MCECVTVKEVWEYDREVSMIYRWTQELIGYHFTVLHRSNNMMRDVDALTRRFGSLIIQHIHTSNILQHMDVTTRPRVHVSERPLPRDTTKLTSEPITAPKVPKRLTTENVYQGTTSVISDSAANKQEQYIQYWYILYYTIVKYSWSSQAI